MPHIPFLEGHSNLVTHSQSPRKNRAAPSSPQPVRDTFAIIFRLHV